MDKTLTRSPRSHRPRRAAAGRRLRLLEDVGRVIEQSADVPTTLDQIVNLIADRLDMEVCSIYSFAPESNRLTLLATKGLGTAAVGQISMGVDEGLTGMVIEKQEPVTAIDAPAHPRFKYFPETGEERYHSFLGVPILDKGKAVGVLVVQTSRRRRFTREEVRLLRAAAAPTGGLLVQRALLQSLESKEEETRGYEQRMLEAVRQLQAYEGPGRRPAGGEGAIRLTGLPAAPGFGIGRAHLITPAVTFASLPRRKRRSAKYELNRLQQAVKRSVREIERLRKRVETSFPEIDAEVFEAQRLMLLDENFTRPVMERIKAGRAPEEALESVVNDMVAKFTRLSEPYMQERAMDIRDIGQRVLRNLLGVAEHRRSFASAVVLVAQALSLSDVMAVGQEHVKGIVIATGGVTSHAAILAKSLEIPTVVGVGGAGMVRDGDRLVVDGNAGIVHVNPRPEVLREYERLQDEYRAFNQELDALSSLPAITRDGCAVRLGANIGLLGDLVLARRHGADHIGLYRTEMAFLSHRDFLTEAEQLELYGQVVRRFEGSPVTIRTLDLGADKYPAYLQAPHEANPFLGWRSIRVSLEMAEVFKVQIRAILRTGAQGRVRMLFPMVSGLEEVERIKDLVAQAGSELEREGHSYDARIPLGIMIEVPSAVQLADRLIETVDFFSIGTNDLTQYLLAVDRDNRKVSSLYEPLHPAVLRAVATTVRTANDAGKGVTLCGEMAGDPVCTLVLLGMGLRDLSMTPLFIPVIKRLIRSVDMSAAERLTSDVLQLGTVIEIKRCIFEHMRALDVVDLMEMFH
jgi:phosphotransferase system enzyme I (PtsP)